VKSMENMAPFAKPKRRNATAPASHPVLKAIDPDRPFIKSYWQDADQPLGSRSADPNSGKKRAAALFVVGEEPLTPIPNKVAKEKQISHQVRAGKGALYHHRAEKVEHMDTIENPYAVFVFEYRSLGKWP